MRAAARFVTTRSGWSLASRWNNNRFTENCYPWAIRTTPPTDGKADPRMKSVIS